MLYLWTQNYSQIIGTCPGHHGLLISQNCVLTKIRATNNAPHTHVLPPKTLVDKIYDPKRLDKAVNSFDPDKAAGISLRASLAL